MISFVHRSFFFVYISRSRETVSLPLTTSPSLRHFVSTPYILISAYYFYFLFTFYGPEPTENLYIYLFRVDFAIV